MGQSMSIVSATLMLLAPSGLRGQPTARLNFEAASVKPNHSGGKRGSMRSDPVRITYTNVTLADCIKSAYEVREY